MKHLLKRHLLATLSILFIVGLTILYFAKDDTRAAPPGSPFAIGETLDPTECVPGGENCTVSIFPDKTGNEGKFLSTDGVTIFWKSIATGGSNFSGDRGPGASPNFPGSPNSSPSGERAVLLSAEKILSVRDIENLQAENKELLPALGVGKYYTILSISASRPNGIPYNPGKPSNLINVTQGGVEIGILSRNILTSDAGGYIYGSIIGSTGAEIVPLIAAPVLIGTRNSDIEDGTGDFNVKIIIWYTINDLL
ncbi:hypothetical protein COB64_01270 [Candidatus Wolfebacteria bacterium]|nr:MAG: hypothetical protein COB64_01270 [Candidatus Wolfebacteria bacterium]